MLEREFRSADHRQIVEILERASGHPLPTMPFPAVLTGIAYPQGVGPECIDPPDLEDCDDPNHPPQAPLGYHSDDDLPCGDGFNFRRYRWRAVHLNLSSDYCGFRLVGETWKIWRQMWFALDTYDLTASKNLDYLPLRAGTSVRMRFGKIEQHTGGHPKWGFHFHHPRDPISIIPCPGNNPPCDQGACVIPGVPPQCFQSCELECLEIGGTWLGPGTSCP